MLPPVRDGKEGQGLHVHMGVKTSMERKTYDNADGRRHPLRHDEEGSSQTGKPFVSIVMPCLQERKHIRAALDSIVAQDYPKEMLEVLVVDGMSDDGTREIVMEFSRRYPSIRLLDNPKRNTPAALNIGIRNARGEIIVRMDAHTTFETDYVARSVKALGEHDADVIGGILKVVPQRNTFLGWALASAVSHPFGVGDSYHRFGRGTKQMPVNTVPFGSYWRRLFDRIGPFDEEVPRSEDADFHRRVKATGGSILLIPDIVSRYHARSNFVAFCKHSLHNGFLVTYYLKYGKTAFFGRHLVPPAFVSAVLVSSALIPFHQLFLWLLVAKLGAYYLANAAASLGVAVSQKNPLYLVAMPVVFTLLHWSYGLGSLYGLLGALTSRSMWRRLLTRTGLSGD